VRRWERPLWSALIIIALPLAWFGPDILSTFEDGVIDYLSMREIRLPPITDVLAIHYTEEDQRLKRPKTDLFLQAVYAAKPRLRDARAVIIDAPLVSASRGSRWAFEGLPCLLYSLSSAPHLKGGVLKARAYGDINKFSAKIDTPPFSIPEIASLQFPFSGWFESVDGMGLNFTPPEADGVFRRFPTILNFRAKYFLHLGVLAATNANRHVELTSRAIKFAERTFPLDNHGYFRPLPRSGGAVPSVSISDFIWADTGTFPVKDRVVVLSDETKTRARSVVMPDGQRVYRSEALAYTISAFSRSEGMVPMPKWQAVLGILAVMGVASISGRLLSPLYAGIIALALSAAVVAGAGALLQVRLVAPVIAPTIGIVLSVSWGCLIHALLRGEDRAKLQSAFGHYLSKPVLERMMKEGMSTLRGRRKHLTILFTDIRGFTTRAEKLPVNECVLLLNRFYDAAIQSIVRHGGTIDKLIGDAVMAFWGDPVEQPDHAARALRAAREIRENLEKLKIGVETGTGIETGEVLVGNLGSDIFVDYTVLGDTVNLAARLEKAAAPMEILVGPGAAAILGETAGLKPKEPIKVKGKAEPVRVFSA